jgi:hypothetical protein
MDIILTLVLAVVSLAIGFVLSTLLHNLRGAGEAGETSELAKSSRYQDLARLWRDKLNENLILEIDGKAYRTVDELSEDQQKEMVLVSSDLRTLLRIFPKPAQITDSEAFTASFDEGPASFFSTTPEGSFGEQERPSLNPFQVFSRSGPESPAQQASWRSIVAQIDEILQEKLEGTAIKDRGIRLLELPNEGMVVMVGLEKFKDVEDIPNEDIRNVIHAAVEEWEQGGGHQSY